MNLNIIEKRVNELTIKRAQDIEAVQSQINAAGSIVSKAAAELSQTQEAGDPKAYAKAATEHRTAKDVLAMYEKQLAALNNSPVITAEEYAELKADIMQTMDQITQNTTEGFMEAMEAIQKLYDEMLQAVEITNKLLHQVQRDLRKVPTATITPEGHRHVKAENMDDTYKTPDVHGALFRMISTQFYKQLMEGK